VSRPLLYVAYPMKLDLGAANAIQTYYTVTELSKLVPGMRLVVPRWLREKSAFSRLNALHLPRPAVNKISRFVPWAGWSYIERTLYSVMLVLLLLCWRFTGRGYRVIYVRDTVCAAWLAMFKWLHGTCLIYEVHDLEAGHPSKASRWPGVFWGWFLPWLDRRSLQGADRIVSLTGTFNEWLVIGNLRRVEDVCVVPDAFAPPVGGYPTKAEARQTLSLPAGAYIVGYAGLTFAYRRLDLLLEAFAQLVRQDDDAILLLVGGRPNEVRELRSMADKLGMRKGQLITTGQVEHEQTTLYLAAADVLVIPDTVTQMTASPLKLFEYMAAGRPIICKDMPALREIVDENAALFFPEGDAAALAACLLRLKLQPEVSERLGQNALKLSEQYTYRSRATKIAEVVSSCR
jgi:glycosyltransferase involved in cell wall biosynthesis